MSENLKLWNSVKTTDSEFIKKVEVGRKFTTVDPYYRFMRATEMFGPFGGNWKVINENFQIVAVELMMYTATLVVKYEGETYEIPLHSSMKLSNKKGIDAEIVKKIATDALTKGLSMLGFSADVFLGAFDGDRYVGDKTDDYIPEEQKLPTPKVGDGNVSDAAKRLMEHWGATEMGANALLGKLHTSKKMKKRYALREITDEIVEYIINNNLK